jgi:hypothetical protein
MFSRLWKYQITAIGGFWVLKFKIIPEAKGLKKSQNPSTLIDTEP